MKYTFLEGKIARAVSVQCSAKGSVISKEQAGLIIDLLFGKRDAGPRILGWKLNLYNAHRDSCDLAPGEHDPYIRTSDTAW
jgi:hypothetical protein